MSNPENRAALRKILQLEESSEELKDAAIEQFNYELALLIQAYMGEEVHYKVEIDNDIHTVWMVREAAPEDNPLTETISDEEGAALEAKIRAKTSKLH